LEKPKGSPDDNDLRENGSKKDGAEESQTWLAWAAGESYEDAWKAIIRPFRDIYREDQLGPSKFSMRGHRCRRVDITLNNVEGHPLRCSHFVPVLTTDPNAPSPCVVYLHGNSSSRLEAHDCVKVCLQRDIGVFCFDFAGSGLSGGDYITLGANESQDLLNVLDYLRKSRRVSSIALWGRSMGATTAILAAGADHNITAVVADSPFGSLRQVIEELLTSRLSVPMFILNLAIESVLSEVRQRTGVDMNRINPIEVAPMASCPVLFGACVEDDLVQCHHSQDLYTVWGHTDRDIRRFDHCDHNDPRPGWWLREVGDFLETHLMGGVAQPAPPKTPNLVV
jgi:cephalosporin-C deacetylase-like acetyl esterase